MTDWNPAQYHLFRDERRRPFYDLLDLIQPAPSPRAVDLGCGSGELTRALHARIGARETLGVDSSPAMLAEARRETTYGVSFELGDIAAAPETGPFDLVFSNAALHWLDDQPRALRRVTALLAPRGQLAVQVPANFDHPSHVVAAAVAREPPFREALSGYTRAVPILAPDRYAELLDELGYTEQVVRLNVYGHHLAERGAVVEWVKGTLLVDYQRRMPPELFPEFLERYREALLPALADRRPYFYAFKRILFWARRP